MGRYPITEQRRLLKHIYMYTLQPTIRYNEIKLSNCKLT